MGVGSPVAYAPPLMEAGNANSTGPVLVTGGAGYVGSHAVRCLMENGIEVVIVDDLSTGFEALAQAPLEVVDIRDKGALLEVMGRHKPRAVMHFAAKCYVGESVHDPQGYYEANMIGAWNVLCTMREVGCSTIVMSSTCAVYGVPQEVPIPDDHARDPISPYGRSKLAVEFIADDFARAYGFRVARLRYFNAAGASSDASIGELHEPETHIIPLVMRAAQPGAKPFTIFGTDYDTPDGTCVRDYVHVEDLADAHLLALARAEADGSFACNLGTGHGYSVREVIDSVERVSGLEVACEIGERREGDPPVLVSGGLYARDVLGWTPKKADLDKIVEDAWRFEQAHSPDTGSP